MPTTMVYPMGSTKEARMPTAMEKATLTNRKRGGDRKMTSNANATFAPVESIPEITRAGKALELLQEFIDSGMEMAEVTAETKSFATSLKNAAKKSALPVEVFNRQGRAYLRRTSEAPAATESASEAPAATETASE